MPITKSAKKALRSSKRKQVVNNSVRSKMKSAMDTFRAKPSAEMLSEAFSRIDRAVKMHLLHRNTAARRKSLLSRMLAQQGK